METCGKVSLIHANNSDARARLLNDPERIIFRTLAEGETEGALALAWKVFQVYEAPVYTAEGTEEFRRSLKDETFLAGIRWYGAFDGERLVGMVGIRPDRCHICLFFVDGKYHRRGIGTRLFQRVREDFPDRTITLNSSPYALPFYEHLGFTATDREQTVNGLRFTPMECRVTERETGI
ncbi:MAG: GNAT family N-acetyltransferase [Erysipelotrichaceae bacterium]|nr:GNAT family N-acetyltransferase [Erysipelotrichaceae bacterium]